MSDKLTSKYWRLNNIYSVVDKKGQLVKFKFNLEQQKIWDECFDSKGLLKYSPDVLKARQLGVTTFFVLNYFDDCIFHKNLTCYIQSHEQDSIKKIFRIVKTAYDNLPINLKPELDRGGGSQYEFYFPDINSRIYVGLENRSNTVHRLHISETAFQEKERIVATLGSLPPDICYSRETTPNRINWYFEDRFMTDLPTRKKMFFPWFINSEYKAKDCIDEYTQDELDYIEKVKNKAQFNLTKEQMSFRRIKAADLLSFESFDQEYPTDEETCFLVGDPKRLVIPEAGQSKTLVRIVDRPDYFNPFVFIDLGADDCTAMLFGYTNFKTAQIVIEKEYVVSYKTTGEKTAEAKRIEKELGYTKPWRISDNDLQQVLDLNKDHNYKVLPVTKRSKQPNTPYKESILNGLRMGILHNKIIIHPDCKNLIFQLSYGMWNEKRTDFERNYDLKNIGIVMGHLDALMALAYGVDNVDLRKNPYPDERELALQKLGPVNRQIADEFEKFKKNNKKNCVRKHFGL